MFSLLFWIGPTDLFIWVPESRARTSLEHSGGHEEHSAIIIFWSSIYHDGRTVLHYQWRLIEGSGFRGQSKPELRKYAGTQTMAEWRADGKKQTENKSTVKRRWNWRRAMLVDLVSWSRLAGVLFVGTKLLTNTNSLPNMINRWILMFDKKFDFLIL